MRRPTPVPAAVFVTHPQRLPPAPADAAASVPAWRQAWQALGISDDMLAGRALAFHPEAAVLEPADGSAPGPGQAPWLLAPAAAVAWRALRTAAAADGVVLELASAFRSVARQAALIRRRLDQGEALAQVLCSIAPPGTSEHHTGRAVDIATPGQPALEECFEDTAAFAWLQQHAGRFGFTLSYPRGNAHGYVYEPWHWCHGAEQDAA